MNFKQWLENTDIDFYISPDEIWDNEDDDESGISAIKGGCTFIYGKENFFYSDRNDTHMEVVDKHEELKDFLWNGRFPGRESLERFMLCGRCAEASLNNKKFFVISIWNRNLQELVDPCIQMLHNKNLITPGLPIFISTPHGNKIINQKESTPWQGKKTSPEEWEKYKALHLARGKEKQRLMQDLGLGFGPKQRPDAEKQWPLRPESFTQWLKREKDYEL